MKRPRSSYQPQPGDVHNALYREFRRAGVLSPGMTISECVTAMADRIAALEAEVKRLSR